LARQVAVGAESEDGTGEIDGVLHGGGRAGPDAEIAGSKAEVDDH
jgi:hypothetical protein